MTYERGIILGADAEIDIVSNKVHILTSEPNAGLLRHALLYWDKIDFPQNNIIHIESRDIEFLKQAGIAQTTQIRINMAGEMASLLVAAQFAAFRQLNSANPDMWTLGQHTKYFTGLSSEITNAQLAEIEINSVLPTPPDDTPLGDILELKQKRQNEFRSLRIAVDEIYDEVLKSAQMPRAESAAIHRLQTVISDIRSCVDKSWLDRLKSSVKFDFNIPSALFSAIGGGAAASVILPGLAPIGAAVGAVSNTIKFESKLGSVLKSLPESSKSFAYLYYVERAFGHR